MAEFVKVADALEMPPGARKLCKVAGRQVMIFNIAGRLYAIDNRCPHAEGPVGAGPLDDVEIACPRHGWRFNLATGDCLQAPGHRLTCHEIVLDGEAVLLKIEAPEPASSIYHYLVRFGVPGYVGRFGSIREVDCRRGDRVVVQSDRGLELGEVLVDASDATLAGSRGEAAGELIRPVEDEDILRQEDANRTAEQVARRCRDLLVRQNLPIEVVQAEGLLDGECVILYFLGEPTAKLGPVSVELGQGQGQPRVEFRSLTE